MSVRVSLSFVYVVLPKSTTLLCHGVLDVLYSENVSPRRKISALSKCKPNSEAVDIELSEYIYYIVCP
jgi:hypothetical protein